MEMEYPSNSWMVLQLLDKKSYMIVKITLFGWGGGEQGNTNEQSLLQTPSFHVY